MQTRMRAWTANVDAVAARLRWNQDYIDMFLALVLAGIVFGVAVGNDARLDLFGAGLLLGQTLPLAFRRQNPLLMLAITGGSIALYSGFGYREVGGNVGVLIAFYTVAAHRPRRHVALVAGIVAIGVFLTLVNYAARQPEAMEQLLVIYLEYAVAWLMGDYVRVRRLYIAELEERAVRLEREREEKARLAVTEERGRIARELHDVVAHHVSVMVVQAAAARRVCETNPELAREALSSVEDAGRTALAEMRRMLEVLRAERPGLAPQPRLGELETLVSQVRDAGLPVSLAVVGEPRELPAGIDLAAYRIVQEALTNVVKHAGPKAEVSVTLTYTSSALEIVVEDNGRGAAAALSAPAEGGHGLIGMRERVALYGGRLDVGPKTAGGFRVSATLAVPKPESKVPRRATLSELADDAGDRPGVPSDGNVYPWPEYP